MRMSPLLLLLLAAAVAPLLAGAFRLPAPDSISARTQRRQLQQGRLSSTTDAAAVDTVAGASTSPGAAGATGGRKKVVVIGAGWAGLGAAHELAKRCVELCV